MVDVQEQIERRRKRATEDIAAIENKGSQPVYSLFDVTSQSKQTYRVQIRSLTDLLNSCSCADYKTNLLGTCKHIEAVLLHLKENLGDQWDAVAAQRPPVSQIFLHHAEETTVRITLPLPEKSALRETLHRYFDADGLLTGSVTKTLPALLQDIEALSAAQRDSIQITPEVYSYLERLQDIEAIQRQKEWFTEQIERGQRSLNLLSTPLYPYQEQGAMHLAFGRRAMLADDMGLGKTVQAIAASSLLNQLRDIQRVLVVCPASLKHQWAREIKRFTSFPAEVIEGDLTTRRNSYHNPAFFNIINYELVLRDEEDLRSLRPDLIILDEAQRIKNWRTKTADAVKRLRSPYAFVLTGTPLENRLDELYSIFQFIDPNILGPLWRFNQRFFQVERRSSGSYKVLGYKNLEELRHEISPYVLRRVRDEVLKDLPERIDSNFFVPMTDPQWKAYDEYRNTVAKLIATARRRPLTPKEHQILLGALVKMRLICNALALHDPHLPEKEREKTSPKLQELAEILDDEVANNGHKAILFSQWTTMLHLTYPVLNRLNLGHVTLSGDVPTPKRGALIERFFNDDQCKVFLSTDAGGVGLNLQAASLVVNLDLPWNPAVLDQRIARAHRHGQPHTVNVINLVAKGTIEERMLDTLAAKRDVFAGVFGSEEAPDSITFHDTGQSLMQKLDEMLGAPPVEVKVDLAPKAAPEPAATPTLRAFADLLVGHFPGRIMLVRRAPHLPGAQANGNILVVVDKTPADLRPQIEKLLTQHFSADESTTIPGLHLMEQEGYRALLALTGGAIEQPGPQAEGDLYRAPSMPAPAAVREADTRRLQKAREGLDTAGKRLQLARVVLQGGFPEEVMRPIHQALGWALTAHLTLVKDREPGPELPSPRLVQAELVESKRIDESLAARLAHVRELTAPPGDEEEAPPPSIETAENLIETVQDLVNKGYELVAEAGL
ncbi:MAG: DEAD/DEAH box helicase family protein [Anaerolineae bacterium]|nr:DEAD/DEAH box helicase family protein [Anaerolineae bacterium]